MPSAFIGFSKDFFAFFEELAANNDRTWFEANKPRYKEVVVGSMSAFIEAMGPRLAKISSRFVADPRPTGGSMFRIYRDVRFSKDKRPYKENAGCHFRHTLGKDAHAPGFYVHLEASRVFFGGGLWLPPSENLRKIREAIAGDPRSWQKIGTAKAFKAAFPEGVGGDGLKRPPAGFDAAHPCIDDIKRKTFYAMCPSTPQAAQSPDFLDEVETALRAAKPLMAFLCAAVDAPF